MHWLWMIFLFALGACVGSFLNVVIYRLPRGESIVFPGSHCPQCGSAIRWQHNIPLVSYLVLRGRCHVCKGRISPRYFVIELLTATLVGGLYACYFLLRLRDGAGEFADAWPMYVAHAALLCGLLACSAVDIEMFIVLLPVMWVCAGVGVGSAAFRPHAFLPPASPAMAAGACGAVLGLLAAKAMLRVGWLLPSFLDAAEKTRGDGRPGGGQTVGVTARDGVNPRLEILREAVFLAPAAVLAAAAYLLVANVPAIGRALAGLADTGAHPLLGPRLTSVTGALVGLLAGGAWIWGTRILGTLAFGREAMGMGDVHILAAVGAVAGWKVASLAFFAAPMFGLGWALYLLAARGKRELPYGPWLALGTLAVMLFYDAIVGFITPY